MEVVKELIGLHVRAADGNAGRISDVLFDGHSWQVLFLSRHEATMVPADRQASTVIQLR